MPPQSEQLQTRTRDEVLAFVYQRGTLLRRRRAALRSAVVAAVVLAAALPVALIVYDGAGREDGGVQIVDMPPTTLPPSPDTPPEADDASGALGHRPASGGEAASQAIAPARSLVPKLMPIDDPDADQRYEIEACGPAEVALTTDTDKDDYLPGETVTVTARIRNTSNHPCLAPTGANLSIYKNPQALRFQDQKPTQDNGNFVWTAGQTIELLFTWPTCGTAQCPITNGTFTARVTWAGPGDYAPSSAMFVVGTPDSSVNICCPENSSSR